MLEEARHWGWAQDFKASCHAQSTLLPVYGWEVSCQLPLTLLLPYLSAG